MGAPEAQVEKYLVRRCRDKKLLCWKFIVPSRNGVPDRIVIGGGRIVFVETKAPGGKPRKLQKRRIMQMRHAGADVRVISSREAVDEFVSEYDSFVDSSSVGSG